MDFKVLIKAILFLMKWNKFAVHLPKFLILLQSVLPPSFASLHQALLTGYTSILRRPLYENIILTSCHDVVK